jgi:hypothetical protein
MRQLDRKVMPTLRIIEENVDWFQILVATTFPALRFGCGEGMSLKKG